MDHYFILSSQIDLFSNNTPSESINQYYIIINLRKGRAPGRGRVSAPHSLFATTLLFLIKNLKIVFLN